MKKPASFNPRVGYKSGNANNCDALMSIGEDVNVPITIVGLQSIDRIIIGFCPKIVILKAEEIEIISTIIQSFIFGRIDEISEIEAIITPETIEFIEGIRILIKEQNIATIKELQDHFDIYIKAFDDFDICGKNII